MKNTGNEYVSSGISFWGLLQLMLIGLKLANVIKWSWLWVLAPIWAPIALAIIFLVVYVVVALIVDAVKSSPRNKGKKGKK